MNEFIAVIFSHGFAKDFSLSFDIQYESSMASFSYGWLKVKHSLVDFVNFEYILFFGCIGTQRKRSFT